MASTAAAFGEIMLAVIAVVLLVGGMIWLAKRGYFEPDVNEDTAGEREEFAESVGEQDFRIPFRRRVGAWSAPMKVFVGSLVLLGIAAAFATYQVLKTGSPASQYLTREVRYGVVGIAGIGGGVHLKRWFDDQLAHVDVEYERAGQENIVERIPYVKNQVRRLEAATVVPVVAKNRLFGLFWRYRQVGEDRRLRSTDKPLDDIKHVKIPDHASERPDGSGFHVTTREDGDQVLKGATTTADLTFSSPHSLSDERAVEIREKLSRKDAELRSVKATNAELYTQIRKLRKAIKNDEYEDRTQLMDDLDQFSRMLSTMRVELEDQTTKNGTKSSAVDDEEASA